MSYVLGVDGCRGGWIAARLDDTSVGLSLAVFPSMTALLAAHEGAECIAIDIPIGLTDGPRLCDVRAREFIGARRSSVFPAPCRAALGVRTYEEAATASLQATGKSLSRQAFAIIPKIREVDDAMSPKLQERVREVHPEVCFRALRGRPLEYAKKGLVSSTGERNTARSSVVIGGVSHGPNGSSRTDVVAEEGVMASMEGG